MPTTSKVVIDTLVTGSVEGGSANSHSVMKNSTGCRTAIETTFGVGVANATTFVSPPTAKFLTIIPPSSNASGWRLANSTAEVGLPMSSQGASLLSIVESTAGTTWFAYSTSTRAISGVRIIWL